MTHPAPGCLLLVALAVTSCDRAAGPPLKPPPKASPALSGEAPDDSAERTNLLNIAHGATVVSRTGESTLETSAINTIDGDPASAWLSPPFDPEQTFEISLASPTRVSELGVRRGGSAKAGFRTMQVERSMDGVTFEPLATMHLKETSDEQLVTVPPTEVSYLRFNILEPTGTFTQLSSLSARGEATAKPASRSLDGCWSVNGMTGAFVQKGSQVFGHLGDIRLEGATDGRSFRLAWSRGPEYGVAMITVSPDNAHLSGIKWHEEALSLFIGDNWFGERLAGCVERPENHDEVLQTWTQRAGRFPLYGLLFDKAGALTAGSSPAVSRIARILASHAGKPLRFTGYADPRQLGSLHKALEQGGANLAAIKFVQSRQQRRELVTDAMRVMYGTIDLEIRR